jgi:hypothetical protein
MGYEIVVDEKNKIIEIHSDVCDRVIEKKDDYQLNNELFYVGFNLFEEVEEFLKNHEGFEIVECSECEPIKNKEILDEMYDDFYEEFDEDEDFDSTRCDIF